MTPAATRRLARTLFVAGLVGLVAGVVWDIADGRPGVFAAANATQPVAFLAIGLAGFAIARRQPGNAVGWIYLGVWTSVAASFSVLNSYAYWGTIAHPGLPGATLAVWATNWIWVPIFVTLLTFPFLLFPDGHLPSPRWRPAIWAIVVAIVFGSVTFALQNHDYTDAMDRSARNPFVIRGLVPFFDAARLAVGFAFVIVVAVSLASLVVRFRRGRGQERQQIKWVTYTASILLVWIALPLDHGVGGPVDVAQGFVLALIPASVGIAIVKYRLYDIDLVIRKTVVVGAMALFITLLYTLIVGLGSQLFDSSLLSFAAAAVLAVAFQPMRDRARRLADRIVYGKRATPYEVLADFSGRMGEAYGADDVLPRMAQVLAAGTGAEVAVVWLRVGDELHPSTTFPAGATPPADPPQDAVEVLHQGERLGALSVAMPASDPMDPARHKLVEDLAAQAGLVLRNVRLIEELRASRQRLVAAQDEERRRLERNIHDGAQQQLVALAVQLKLARTMLERDAAKAAEILDGLQARAGDALEDLRDLARGIYPPLLADKGLPTALEAQARKASVPTTVSADGIARYAQDVEAAVYFSCLEALNNVAKYAGASAATVALSQTNGDLTFVVTDDGRGFDPRSTGYGTGLQGIADRLDAIGGALAVDSRVGAGTTVTGTVPAPAQRSD